MEKINFNKLAWNAPRHENGFGYIPSDKYYEEIVEWLKSCKRLYRNKSRNVTVTRISIPDCPYDAIVEFYHENKMFSWIFQESNTIW